MTTDTKVADLPELPKPDWKAKDGVSEGVYSATQMREFGMACYQAALARQEADNASSPNVIYRWRALDYSGFCYGSNPPHDLPSEACLTAFYRDPEGLRSALHEISATGNMTATDKQFSRHLQQIARDALAGAAPPAAQAVDQWQPIETAPRDRTPFIAWFGDYAESGYFVDDGIFVWQHDGDSPIKSPTHWMPLPALPIDQQAGKGGA